MIVFKLFGIVMIAFSSTMIGLLKSKSLLLRCRKLEQVYDASDILYNHINQGDYELEKALKNSFTKCDFLSVKNEKYLCNDVDLNSEDKLIINGFLKGLGDSVKSVECERVSAFKIKIKSQLKSAQNDRDQKCKIYQALGICTGLVIGILLI